MKASLAMTLNEAIKYFHDNQQTVCWWLMTLSRGIVTYIDVRRYLSKMPGNMSNTKFLDVCGEERKNFMVKWHVFVFVCRYLHPSFSE